MGLDIPWPRCGDGGDAGAFKENFNMTKVKFKKRFMVNGVWHNEHCVAEIDAGLAKIAIARNFAVAVAADSGNQTKSAKSKAEKQ